MVKTTAAGIVLLAMAGMVAGAGSLRVDDAIVTRDDSLKATLKLPTPLKGEGKLTLTWSDSYGRTVAVESAKVQVDGAGVPILLPLGRAVAIQNFLSAELTVGESTVKAPRTEFVVTPKREWDDYYAIMYYPYRPGQQPHLRDVGVNAGQIQSGRARDPNGGRIWWECDYPFYCDQLAFRYYAAYHDPALNPKTKRMQEAKAAYRKDRASKLAFYRKPCFHDPAARASAMEGMRRAVRAQMRFKPLFYATDEAGVANLVEAWDFCYDPRTLAEMRKWLLAEYGSLAAINRQWGTDFATLRDVVPLTTDEMMKRGDWNLSSWADHRTFMNITFAEAVKEGSDAVKSVDPEAKAGLVGCQMPAAFGGYDYWLLSRAMDAVEPYNIGNNREIWRSFAPEKPAVTTGFGARKMESWRLWYQALHGDLGVIIYDEQNRYLTADGAPTPLGAGIAPTYKELTGGICKQLAHMQRVNDPVAIHYSHPSITAHWMFERRPLGEAWVNKGSWHERRESDFLRLRAAVIYLLEDNTLQYRFVSYEQLEDGAFDKMDSKVMILPQSVAMSKAECDAVRRFVTRGGTLIADCRTALMDEHCRMLEKGQLDELFGIERQDVKFAPGPPGLRYQGLTREVMRWMHLAKVPAAEPGIKPVGGATALFKDAKGTPAVIVKSHGQGRTIYLNAVITDYHRWRMKPPEGEDLREYVARLLREANVRPAYQVTTAEGEPAPGVEVHPWRCGDLRIIGVHRNYGLRVSELGPPEYHTQAALERPMRVKIDFGASVAVYDQRKGKFLGTRRSVVFPLDRYEPTLLTILPEPVKELLIEAPSEAAQGELLEVKLRLVGPKLGRAHAFRVRLLDAHGKELRPLTANLAAPEARATWKLPIAASDAKGQYTLEARDVATGLTATHKLTVK